MTLIDFDDAVTASNLDPNQRFAVYYADGRFANHTAVAQRCPKAKLFGITVGGLTGPAIFACDCERGDLTVAQALAWVSVQVRLNVPLICVYANQDTWLNQGLLTGLQKYGHRIKRWLADFNNVPSIPAWADADQFADPGPVDRNVALANFFTGVSPVVAKPKGTVRAIVSFDLATEKVKSVHGIPGIGVRFAGAQKWMDVAAQIQAGKPGGGRWRGKP